MHNDLHDIYTSPILLVLSDPITGEVYVDENGLQFSYSMTLYSATMSAMSALVKSGVKIENILSHGVINELMLKVFYPMTYTDMVKTLRDGKHDFRNIIKLMMYSKNKKWTHIRSLYDIVIKKL